MAHLNRRVASRIAAAACSMIMLGIGGSLVGAAAVSASVDVPPPPQCGPDPLPLIDPCEILPPPVAGGPTADPTPQIPWDVVDSVLFG